MKMLFNRRSSTSNVDKKHSKSKSNSKSNFKSTNTLKTVEMNTSSRLENALERYFSSHSEKFESASSITEDFTVAVSSLSSSSFPSLDGSSIGSEASSSRPPLQRYLFQDDVSELDEDEPEHLFAEHCFPLKAISKEEALSKIMVERKSVREQLQDTETLIDQRSLKVALYFQDENCGIKKRHQVIIEMQRLLKLESQRDCLLNDECELERLQMIMEDNACDFGDVSITFHQFMNRLSSGHRSESNITTAKSADEIYEEAQARAET